RLHAIYHPPPIYPPSLHDDLPIYACRTVLNVAKPEIILPKANAPIRTAPNVFIVPVCLPIHAIKSAAFSAIFPTPLAIDFKPFTSEEHKYELQSRFKLVCCLML